MKTPNIDENDKEIIDDDIKYNKILSAFRSSEQEYTCFIYKKNGKGRTLVGRMDSDIPDPIDDLYEKYNGGNFRIIIRNEKNELLDSADINVMEKKDNNSNSREQVLNEVKTLMEMVKPTDSGSQNIILIEMMKMQAENSKNMAEMIQKQGEMFIGLQKESERRFSDLIEKLSESKSGEKTSFSELLDAIEVIDNIRGERENKEESTLDKIISSPFAQQLLFKAVNNENKTAIPAPIKKTPADYVKSIPDEIKQQVTRENAAEIIDIVYKQNSSVISKSDAESIVNTILQERGLV